MIQLEDEFLNHLNNAMSESRIHRVNARKKSHPLEQVRYMGQEEAFKIVLSWLDRYRFRAPEEQEEQLAKAYKRIPLKRFSLVQINKTG